METRRPIVELVGIVKRFGAKTVLPGFDLAVRDGEFLTLLGPSGCGKTTVLRVLAGFEAPDAGDVLLDGARVNGLPPDRRGVNTVFQSYALFPHLTVFENVAFGLRMKRVGRAEIGPRVDEALRMVRLEGYERRRPHELSGGEQQRVAIARAAVNRPRVLLLDEPLNALDFKLRKAMQVELKELQRRLAITFVFVTHDQEEALSMSDRVVVMREGRVEQVGTPREVYESPLSLFVAGFVGESNVLDAVVTRRVGDRAVEAELEGASVVLRTDRPFAAGDRVKVVLRPEDLRIEEIGERRVADGQLAGRVVERNYKGMTLDSVIRLDSGTRVLASEFFDEDDPSFDHALGVRVAVSWVPSWEVVLPDG